MQLGQFKGLEYFDLSFNQIGVEGFKQLTEFYMENREYVPN